MTLSEKIQKVWENRTQIAEGWYNQFLSNDPMIKEEIDKRLWICRSNICGHYDSEGKPENAVMPGSPSCAICKCNIGMKTACMSCHCALQEIGQKALWGAVMTADQENAARAEQYNNQFKPKQ